MTTDKLTTGELLNQAREGGYHAWRAPLTSLSDLIAEHERFLRTYPDFAPEFQGRARDRLNILKIAHDQLVAADAVIAALEYEHETGQGVLFGDIWKAVQHYQELRKTRILNQQAAPE